MRWRGLHDTLTTRPAGPAPADQDATVPVPADQADPAGRPADEYAVRADGLGLRGRDGWVYRGVDLAVPAGSVLVVAGPAGSGRSSLLLTLAGRMRPSEGCLAVFGEPLPARNGAARAQVAVARIGGVVELEPRLTVAEALVERALLDGVERPVACRRLNEACGLLALRISRQMRVGEVPPAEQVLVALALATVGRPRMVVVDDVGAGLPPAEQLRGWRGLRQVAGTGVTVVAATTDPGPAQDCLDVLCTLGGTPGEQP